MHACHRAKVKVKDNFRDWFFPSTMGVWGLNLTHFGPSGKHPYLLSHLMVHVPGLL